MLGTRLTWDTAGAVSVVPAATREPDVIGSAPDVGLDTVAARVVAAPLTGADVNAGALGHTATGRGVEIDLVEAEVVTRVTHTYPVGESVPTLASRQAPATASGKIQGQQWRKVHNVVTIFLEINIKEYVYDP